GAFIWDEVMLRLAERFRCIAPNLRGYERSSAPSEVAAYRAKHLMADIGALIEQIELSGPDGEAERAVAGRRQRAVVELDGCAAGPGHDRVAACIDGEPGVDGPGRRRGHHRPAHPDCGHRHQHRHA
ncbi:hypothetical protein ACVBEH_22315, partial [Roseateles sp. GG27B]